MALLPIKGFSKYKYDSKKGVVVSFARRTPRALKWVPVRDTDSCVCTPYDDKGVKTPFTKKTVRAHVYN